MFFVARRQGDHQLRQTGNVVYLFFDRQAGTQVVEFHGTRSLSEDREGERIPFGKDLAMVDGFALDYAEACAVYHVIALFLATLFVDDSDQACAIHRDGCTAAAL